MNLNLGEFSWSARSSVIDGVLYHNNPVDHSLWCMVVPSDLHQTLLKEAYSSVFSGHFSERFKSDFIDSTGGTE